MDMILIAVCSVLVILGTGAAVLEKDPFKKIISLSVLVSGIYPFIIDRGFLDVAMAIALIIPLSTIFLLMACRKEVGI
jgi:energy-converting hydrogenase A subunit D